MPLLNDQEELNKWIAKHQGPLIKVKGKKVHDPYVAIGPYEPKQFPCWLAFYFFSADCAGDHYACEFIYQDASGQWDLETYEREIGWG